MTATLFARSAGEGPAVVLLHGLFGAGSNLGALSRGLQSRFTVYSVDLPNHGRSEWLESPDLVSMAHSLRCWMDEEGMEQAHLVGHSLGGKVAMQLALACPECIRGLVVADIAPVAYPAHHDEVFAALDAVSAARPASRGATEALMGEYLQEEGVIQFLSMSLQRTLEQAYDWRFDRKGLKEAYTALLASPAAENVFERPALFIKGGASDYIRQEHWPATLALFPQATLRELPGCGHWLHVEAPERFNALVANFLSMT
jgi:esterase